MADIPAMSVAATRPKEPQGRAWSSIGDMLKRDDQTKVVLWCLALLGGFGVGALVLAYNGKACPSEITMILTVCGNTVYTAVKKPPQE